MSRKRHYKSNSQYFGWKSFVFLPILFCVLSISVVVFSIGPILSPILSSINLFLVDSDKIQPAAAQNLFANAQIKDSQPATILKSSIQMPKTGDEYGNVKISGTAIDAPVFYGDSPTELNSGVGTYTGSWLPGFGHTILMGAHNTTWFADMKNVEVGSIITISTHYGVYTYKINSTAIKDHMDTSAYDLTRENENIILYTCYPFDFVGITPNRFFVYGEYVSGPVVVNE